MCLTAQALALFLNVLNPDVVASEPGRFIIRSDAREAHWVAVEDRWCTMAPQIEQGERQLAQAAD